MGLEGEGSGGRGGGKWGEWGREVGTGYPLSNPSSEEACNIKINMYNKHFHEDIRKISSVFNTYMFSLNLHAFLFKWL